MDDRDQKHLFKKTRKFIIEPFTIYRKSDLWIRHEFDLDGSEGSVNKNYIEIKTPTGITSVVKPTLSYNDGPFWKQEQSLDDQERSYWSLKSDIHGWVELILKDEFNLHRIYEVSFDYSLLGPGHLQAWLNSTCVLNVTGPYNWTSTKPHLALDYLHIRCRYLNVGLGDPPPRSELDNLCVYYYTPIDCDFTGYKPAKASRSPVEIVSLGGFSTFQATTRIGTIIETGLYFYSEKEHTEFVKNADRPHVIVDDKGTVYHGSIELGECTYIGRDNYLQQIIFKSPCKLGEGWI